MYNAQEWGKGARELMGSGTGEWMINMYERKFNLGMVRMRRDIEYWRWASWLLDGQMNGRRNEWKKGTWGSHILQTRGENPSRTAPSHPSSTKGSIHDWGKGGCNVQGGPGTCEGRGGYGRRKEIWWVLLEYFRVEGGIHGRASGDQSTGRNTTDPRDMMK